MSKVANGPAHTRRKPKSDIVLSCTYRIQCSTQRLSSRTLRHYSRLFCLWLNFCVFSHVKWSFTLPKDTKYQLMVVYSRFDTGRQFDYCLTACVWCCGRTRAAALMATRSLFFFHSIGHSRVSFLCLAVGHRTYAFRCDICFSIFGN